MSFLSLIRRAFFRPQTATKKGCWKIVGCSQAGTAHLRRGRSCEDAVDWFKDDDLLVIAVADGAGSAAHPALGSALAVRTACRALADHHKKISPITAKNSTQALAFTCQKTLNALGDLAHEMNVEPSDLACTLIVVIATKNFVTAAQVGDGAVVLRDDKQNIIALTTPTNGGYANETVLLGCNQTTDVGVWSFDDVCPKSIAVFTDGLQRLALLMPQGTPHAPFFQPLFDQLNRRTEAEMEQALRKFLNSPQVNNRTDDDKSLVTAQLV